MLSDAEVAAIRDGFPWLSQRVYLDTGATGLPVPGAGAAAARVYDRLMAQGYDCGDQWRALGPKVAGRLAACTGVAASGIVFAQSSADALIRVLSSLPMRAGDRVVMAADEFPTFLEIGRQWQARGAELVLVPIGDEGERTERLAAAVTPGTRWLGVSHVGWATGTRVDLGVLGAACRASGARLIVDGVHGLGATPVDAAPADAYVMSFFKWMLAGFGLGAAIVAPGVAAELQPAQRGYFNPAPSQSLHHSHLNYTGLAVLDHALDYVDGLGPDRLLQRVAALQGTLAQRLRDDGHSVLTPPGQAAGLTCVAHPDPETAAKALAAQGISVSPRGRALRISTHFYNSNGDLDRLVQALAQMKD